MRHVVRVCIVATLACEPGSNPALNTSAGTVVTPVEFSVETWPGEGIPVIEARRAFLYLHVVPDRESEIVDTLLTDAGVRVHFDSTRYQTIKPGSIAVLGTTSVIGRDLGKRSHLTFEEYYSGDDDSVAIKVTPSSTIELLQYRAEGTCFVRLDQRVINADPCPMFDSATVRVEREPVTRWWIRTRGQHGKSGWLELSDSTAQAVRRQFDEQDDVTGFATMSPFTCDGVRQCGVRGSGVPAPAN
jgi:hypothetical protein